METRERAMYLRQQDIFDLDKATTPITVIGAGSLGSWTVLGLAKLGFQDITVYDDDLVALHNIPNQFFSLSDADFGHDEEEPLAKVVALAKSVHEFTGVRIKAHQELFVGQSLSKVVIVTPDNMATRKQVFLRCMDNDSVSFFVDGRMGGQTYKVYSANPTVGMQARYYLSQWHSDEQGSLEECTARGVGYNAVMCAMEIVNITKRYVMEQGCPKLIVADAMGMWRTVEW